MENYENFPKTHYTTKAYLAGPEVFHKDAKEVIQAKKDLCTQFGIGPLSPLDNELPCTHSKSRLAIAIVNDNIKMIRECDFVIANLSNFRGTETHPNCDSGTAWECGYATAIGKPVLAYTNDAFVLPNEIKQSIDCCTIGDFQEALYVYITFGCKIREKPTPTFGKTISLDPKSLQIFDADALGAFKLGYAYGKKENVAYTISDKRSLITKFGQTDRNGYRFEDFDSPVNIMISVNHRLL